jgi:cytochrome c oxidase subunit 3
MSLIYFHPFHIVDQRPWPLTGAIGAFIITSGTVRWFQGKSNILIYAGIIVLLITSAQWWRDVSREASFQGHHPFEVETNIRLGIILFITSEVLFFVSFFWAFFHSSLAPAIEVGILWPPKNISAFNPFQIPLLNTIILLSSGVSVTWAHHRLIENNHSQTKQGLIITVVLGLYFTALQAYEYYEAPFSFADSVYGSTFFIATGFHGLHVIIGTSFLAVCTIRLLKYHFSSNHHFGFEAAAWYWHFVDVVWLFLFVSIYWWGSCFFIIISIFHFQWKGLCYKKSNLKNYIWYFINHYYWNCYYCISHST